MRDRRVICGLEWSVNLVCPYTFGWSGRCLYSISQHILFRQRFSIKGKKVSKNHFFNTKFLFMQIRSTFFPHRFGVRCGHFIAQFLWRMFHPPRFNEPLLSEPLYSEIGNCINVEIFYSLETMEARKASTRVGDKMTLAFLVTQAAITSQYLAI